MKFQLTEIEKARLRLFNNYFRLGIPGKTLFSKRNIKQIIQFVRHSKEFDPKKFSTPMFVLTHMYHRLTGESDIPKPIT